MTAVERLVVSVVLGEAGRHQNVWHVVACVSMLDVGHCEEVTVVRWWVTMYVVAGWRCIPSG